ncbi:MAG: acetate--CoA ligase family protein, partial [Burkholderiales bacterium]|nr:acetate--CoA ligase family protein [Burkholderiales bacterium]
RDTGELVNAAELYLKGWKPKGRRLVVISNSGATCVQAADAATGHDLPLAKLAQETRDGLKGILPSFATTTNPIDITAALLTNSGLFGQILPVIAKDAAADAFLIGIPVAGQGYDVDAFAGDAAVFARRTGKPVVLAVPQAAVAAKFKAQGLPVFTTESEAVAALAQFLVHAELMQRTVAQPPAVASGSHRSIAPTRTLNEADSLALLARHAIPVVAHRLCQSVEEAEAALGELGAPVAVKACSADMPHKSEWGLVRLNVRDAQGVRSAFHDFDKTLRLAGARAEGVIVAEMVKGQRELMIGAHIDPVFGPVVVIGDGGKYVEAMPDVQLLLPPFGSDDVRRALMRLRIAPLLAGVRGEPPMDVEAFCRTAVTVGVMMTFGETGIASVDLNPVIVGARGEGCRVVDALVVTAHA